jgi:hypothetical protein
LTVLRPFYSAAKKEARRSGLRSERSVGKHTTGRLVRAVAQRHRSALCVTLDLASLVVNQTKALDRADGNAHSPARGSARRDDTKLSRIGWPICALPHVSLCLGVGGGPTGALKPPCASKKRTHLKGGENWRAQEKGAASTAKRCYQRWEVRKEPKSCRRAAWSALYLGHASA